MWLLWQSFLRNIWPALTLTFLAILHCITFKKLLLQMISFKKDKNAQAKSTDSDKLTTN